MGAGGAVREDIGKEIYLVVFVAFGQVITKGRAK